MEHVGLTLRIPKDVKESIAECAKKEERSMNWVILKLLREGILKSKTGEICRNK
ncbi:MAG: Arc family DNA-binding protein [Burkholderiaceae bacterium]|nr:Arc family DNA-binding protein [Burkholderiaceae bacterium]